MVLFTVFAVRPAITEGNPDSIRKARQTSSSTRGSCQSPTKPPAAGCWCACFRPSCQDVAQRSEAMCHAGGARLHVQGQRHKN